APGGAAGKLMTLNRKTGTTVIGQLPGLIEAVVARHDIALVLIDPMIKAHSIPENANTEMDAVAQLLTDMAAKRDIGIDVPHHISKGKAYRGNPDRGRGASAAKDAGRLVYTLSPMSPEEAKQFNISEEDRKGYVRYDRAKLNIARTTGPATWFKLVSVPLCNPTKLYPAGDEVQTLERWEPPSTWAGTTAEGLNKVLNDIAGGLTDNDGYPTGHRYSSAPAAAKDRQVWRVVHKHYPEKTESQCRAIIHAWLNIKLLYTKQYYDPLEYKKRNGLYVDDDK